MKRRKAGKVRLKLPDDIMANILYRVGVIDILVNAQRVCTAWREICKDPAMWRVIYMENFWYASAWTLLQDMCMLAVDRSQGQLVDLTIVGFCDNELMMYIADRASQLRRLKIKDGGDSDFNGWDECLDKFVMLEELSLHTTYISEEALEVVGRYCPRLRTLKVHYDPIDFVFDDMALAIGKNLPELRHLELTGCCMSNIGLRAILDGCGHLESLDLRLCIHIGLKGDLGKRCSKQIKYLKLPDDSLDEESHGVTIKPKIHIVDYDYRGGYELLDIFFDDSSSTDEDEDDDKNEDDGDFNG